MPESPKFDALSHYLHAGTPRELKFAAGDADAGTIEGYTAFWSGVPGGEPDSYGDVVARGAFTKSLAEHAKEGVLPFMLWQHNPSVPVGRWVEMREDARGLFVRGQLNLATEPGQRAYAHLKAGDIRGLSIGFSIYEGGEKYEKGVRILTAIDLKEVSLCTMPAVRRAAITGVKSSFSSRAELEEILRESLPARAAKKLLSGGWSAVSGEGDEPDDQSAKLDSFAKRIDAATKAIKGIR